MKKLFPVLGFVVLFTASRVTVAELLSFYEFDTLNVADSRVILDSSGNANHGVTRGLPDGTPGTPGILDGGTGWTGDGSDRSVGFDANGDIYIATVNNGPDPGGAFQSIIDNQEMTITFWAKPPAADAHQNTFWGWLSPGRSSSIAPWSNNNMYWDTGGCCNGATQRLNDVIDPPDGEWHHWAYTRNSFGDKVIYIDGEFFIEAFDQNAELLGPSEDSPQEYTIGSENPANPVRHMIGEIDDYAIWDEVIDEAGIIKIFENGVRSVVSGLPAEPDQYVPGGAQGRLVNLDGRLGGAAYADDGQIISWRVEELFSTQVGDVEVLAVADLSQAGVAGLGNIGDTNTDVVLGDVGLINNGADDVTRMFRLITEVEDPILGLAETALTESITIPGSGGAVDPFTLLGDLNEDGKIAFDDFLIFSSNFGKTKEGLAGPQVPEPSSLTLLWLAGLLIPVIRRRRV